MKPSLSRWQQNVLLVSCVWVLGVTVFLRYQELPKAQQYATHRYFVCVEHLSPSDGKGRDNCLKNVDRDWDAWMNHAWGRIAAVALLPVGAGWLAIFTAMFAFRRFRPDQARKPRVEPLEPD